jgi:2-polyprenyl-3-methyl-5-hydroxy-6-metoxy-1,4-benzoquinol methylase
MAGDIIDTGKGSICFQTMRLPPDSQRNRPRLKQYQVEQERLDLHHLIYLMLLRGLHYLAPIDKPNRILDVGTGTGIWAQEMAELFPDAEVIGTDLSPIQPSWTPP